VAEICQMSAKARRHTGDMTKWRTRIDSLTFFVRDWWASRGDSRPAPTEMTQVINEASHTGGGRNPISASDRALEQMADGADAYLKSFD